MKRGDKVVCIDDSGWLIPDPGYEHLAPKKGTVYVVRDTCLFGSILAISLIGGNEGDYYRACRFVPLQSASLRTVDVAAEGSPARSDS